MTMMMTKMGTILCKNLMFLPIVPHIDKIRSNAMVLLATSKCSKAIGAN